MRVGMPDKRTRKAGTAISLALVLFVASIPSQPTQAAPLPVSESATVLYRADWSHGLAGWTLLGDRGWSVTHGVLTYSGMGNSELLAPFRLPISGDVAVEAQIEQGRRVRNRQSDRGYGVVANHSVKLWSGVAGGFFYGDQPYTPQSELYWDGDTVSGEDVALHDGYDQFRLERRGNVYSVVENGIGTVHFNINDAHGTRLGLFSRQYRIRVRSLLVLALPTKKASGISLGRNPTLPPLKAFDLSLADVPPTFTRTYGHYYPNAEVARQRNVSVQSLNLLGRIISYEVSYRRPTTRLYDDIYASITVYGTTQAAHVDTQYIISAYQQNRSAPEYTQSVPGAFGDEDGLIAYRYTAYDGSQYDTYDLVFRRGLYRAALELDFPHGQESHEQSVGLVTQLGHVVDERLKKSS